MTHRRRLIKKLLNYFFLAHLKAIQLAQGYQEDLCRHISLVDLLLKNNDTTKHTISIDPDDDSLVMEVWICPLPKLP